MNQRMTNTQFVANLMDFCPKGPLIQPFVIQALISYSEGVLNSPQGFMADHIISEEAWRGLAEHVRAELAKHLTSPNSQPEPEPEPLIDYKWVAQRMLDLAKRDDRRVEVYYEDDNDAPAGLKDTPASELTVEQIISEMEACSSCSIGLMDIHGREFVTHWHHIVLGGNEGEDTVADYVISEAMERDFPEHFVGDV